MSICYKLHIYTFETYQILVRHNFVHVRYKPKRNLNIFPYTSKAHLNAYNLIEMLQCKKQKRTVLHPLIQTDAEGKNKETGLI